MLIGRLGDESRSDVPAAINLGRAIRCRERSRTLEDVVKFADFKLSWLHTFACVARLGGYSKAAAYLKLSQPTVTRQVAGLEAWFGKDLFTKNKPPRLTDYGEFVHERAEKVLWEICNLNQTVNRTVRGEHLSAQEIECIEPLRVFIQSKV
jgi:hypothetical protein